MTSARSFINIANKYDRIVLLVDMDCFYCQVEEKLDPSLAGKPIAVVQYNAWRGGGIIAVNYPARAHGVTRHMRGDEAKEQCPEIELIKVPNVREKADLTKYREAGKEVAAVLQTFTPLLERASVDEAYLDITEQVNKKFESINNGSQQLQPSDLTNTYAVGYENFGAYIQEITSKINSTDEDEYDICSDDSELIAIRKSSFKLLIGASIAGEVRAKVKAKTGYDCSAGIAHNKILAKLACGMNKPNKQTILPLKQIPELFRNLPVGKIKGLGGKFGEDVCEIMKVKHLGDLTDFSEAELQRKFDEKNGSWLHLIARGIDLEAVTPRFYSKSIGCCKKFPGRNAITGLNTLNHWLNELATEISDRLENDVLENNRRAKQMVVSYIQEINAVDVSSSRSSNLVTYDIESLSKNALEILKKNTDQFFKAGSEAALNNPLKFLGISVGKFESIESNQNTLKNMFANQKKKETPKSEIQKMELVPVKEENKEIKQTGRSFFANHFKKQVDIKQNVTEDLPNNSINITIDVKEEDIPNNSNNNTPKAEEKSFFKRFLKDKKDLPFTTKLESVPNTENLFKEIIPNENEVQSTDNTLLFIDLPDINVSNNSDKEQSDCIQPKSEKRKSTDLNESNVSNTELECIQANSNPDYTITYAELSIPELRPEYFIKCDICGQKILSDELTVQSHNDRHFAEQISQQQREEFRNTTRAKFTSPPQKKAKTTSNDTKSSKPKQQDVVKTKPASSITKFLRKTEEPILIEPSCSSKVAEEKECCSECGQWIEISKIAEHADYHMARRIQIEMNKADIRTVSIKKVATPPSSKKLNNTTRVEKTCSKNKSISQFFSSSQMS